MTTTGTTEAVMTKAIRSYHYAKGGRLVAGNTEPSSMDEARAARLTRPCYCSSLPRSIYSDASSPSPRCDFCAGIRQPATP